MASQRAGRLDHEPFRLARLLRSAGQGSVAPVWNRLGELRLPVLAVAGERDERYAEVARRLAAAAPRARAEVIEGVGHAAHLEAPADFAALLLEFLDDHLAEGVVADRDS